MMRLLVPSLFVASALRTEMKDSLAENVRSWLQESQTLAHPLLTKKMSLLDVEATPGVFGYFKSIKESLGGEVFDKLKAGLDSTQLTLTTSAQEFQGKEASTRLKVVDAIRKNVDFMECVRDWEALEEGQPRADKLEQCLSFELNKNESLSEVSNTHFAQCQSLKVLDALEADISHSEVDREAEFQAAKAIECVLHSFLQRSSLVPDSVASGCSEDTDYKNEIGKLIFPSKKVQYSCNVTLLEQQLLILDENLAAATYNDVSRYLTATWNASSRAWPRTSWVEQFLPSCSTLPQTRFVDPLNMPGQGRWGDTPVEICRNRCVETLGCYTYSWWPDGGCHIQDQSATKTYHPTSEAGYCYLERSA